MTPHQRVAGFRRTAVFGLAALFGTLPNSGDLGEAYRLSALGNPDTNIASQAVRVQWDEPRWPPGEELVFDIASDQDWYDHFDSLDEVRSYVEGALAYWSELPGADIRWRVGDFVADGPDDFDDRNVIYVGDGTYAATWAFEAGGTHWFAECDVQLDHSHVDSSDELESRRNGALIHELGHCLGLDHAANSPLAHKLLPRWTRSQVWTEDPRMSFGAHRGEPLLSDDRIGARLMRPAPGWLETVGSIAGRLSLDGAPTRYVAVEALRMEGGQVRPAASVFSNEQGEFVVEGLPPGVYFLWIHPLTNDAAHLDELPGPTKEFDDLVPLQPILVTAGEVSDGHDFALRRGRYHQ